MAAIDFEAEARAWLDDSKVNRIMAAAEGRRLARRKKKRAAPGQRVVEELCQQEECERDGTHWHPLSIESLLGEEDGEYSLTVRVRTIKRKRKNPIHGARR